MSLRLIILCVILSYAGTALPTEVRKVNWKANEVTLHRLNKRIAWPMHTGICLYGEDQSIYGPRRLTCGRIVRMTSETIVLQLSDPGIKHLRPGMWVDTYQTSRLPASTFARVERPALPRFDLGIGLGAGFNYFFPNLKLGMGLSRRLTLGIEPLYIGYSDATSSVTAIGGFLTFNYYLGEARYQGFHFTGGVGLYSMSLRQNAVAEDISPLAFCGLLQWRGGGSWSLGLDVSVGAGVQYVTPKAVAINTSFQSALPLFTLALSKTF